MIQQWKDLDLEEDRTHNDATVERLREEDRTHNDTTVESLVAEIAEERKLIDSNKKRKIDYLVDQKSSKERTHK